jgi:hypothetical protein
VFEYSTRRLEPCAQCQLYLVWSSVSFPGNSHISFCTLLHKHFVLFRHALCDGLIVLSDTHKVMTTLYCVKFHLI